MDEAEVVEVDRSATSALAVIHRRTVLDAYRPFFQPERPVPSEEAFIAEWEGAFSDPTFRAFVAKGRTTALGTVAVRADPRFVGCGELWRLHVVPERWGTGVGGALHDVTLAALREADYRSAGLWVIEGNDRARTFYEHRGWQPMEGDVLSGPGGVPEVRYQLSLR
jgi:GNAT superfamily N-acetyltransferase